MNMGELFAGIGGFSLGFRRAGFDVKWQVEIDPYCRKVLQKNFPEAERFNDVRECGGANLERVDVICGGFPCQDVSSANRNGKGLDGARSGLWSEMLRVVCELRPRYLVVENVAALLNDGLGRVLGELSQIGYDSEWECLPAAAFGGPHLRDRVYVVSHSPSVRWTEGNLHIWLMSPNVGCNSRAWNDRLVAKPGISRVADGVPSRVDRLRGAGNAVVPQIPEWIANRILQAEAQQ